MNKEIIENNQNPKTSSLLKRFLSLLKKNKLTSFLVILLIIVFCWSLIKIKNQQIAFNKELGRFKIEKHELIKSYEGKLDSLKIDQIKFATEVFSWSVRSEMIRENTENLNQLLTIFIKQSGADVVQIIDPKNNKVILSSDKKFEGTVVKNLKFENLSSTQVINEDKSTKIISPVMGFNEKIGVLIVEIKQEELMNESSKYLKEKL